MTHVHGGENPLRDARVGKQFLLVSELVGLSERQTAASISMGRERSIHLEVWREEIGVCVKMDEYVPAQRESLAPNASVDHVQSLVVVLHHRDGQ